MPNELKQTLFRFKTMRTPEQLSEESKTNYYIQHPDGTSGPFFAAVAGMGVGDTKHGVLTTAAAAFSGAKTKADIEVIDAGLSAFGLYLLKNRHKLTYAEVSTEISGLTALSGAQELSIWDTLFYQTITLESGAAREAALKLILANYFVNEFSGMAATDEAMQAWANSRIVMPLELFELESKYLDPTTDNDNITGEEVLTHFVDAAEAKVKTEIIEKALKELATYKADYLKTNEPLELAAVATHQAAIKTARDNATTEVYTDQSTQFTYTRLKGYTSPTFSYAAPAEVDSTAMGQSFSNETMHFLQEEGLFTTETFTELEDKLNEKVAGLTRNIFDNSTFYSEKVAVDGTILSKCGVERRLNAKYTYMIKLIKRDTNKYGAIMVIDAGSDCMQLQHANISFKPPVNQTVSIKKAGNSKGMVSVDLLPGTSIDLTGETGIDVMGEVKFANGLKLDLATGTVPIDGYLAGTLTRNAENDTETEFYIPGGFGISNLGISEYRKVEQSLCCYVPGEVSHIENVMAREYKERSTRRMRRSDDKTTTSSSSESENTTDTSTTSRFDMQSETSSVLSETVDRSKSFGANTNVSGKTPGEITFSVGADFTSDFATSSSSEESNSKSSSFAKDITEKAVSRLTSKVSEERTKRIIEEFEEKNMHGFDNRQGAEHISGVYRWVDKVYNNEVHNFGKRLQYEFMIPEPSAFHLIAKASGATSDSEIPLIKPLDPRKNAFGVLEPIRNSAHILPSNYHQWAAAYGAEVQAPPAKNITVGKNLTKPQDGTEWHVTKVVTDQIVIPDGYGIRKIFISGMGNGDKTMIEGEDGWDRFIVSVAGITQRYWTDTQEKVLFASDWGHPELLKYSDSIPVSAQFTGFDGGIVSISVELQRKHDLMEKWQLETFSTIMAAYEERLMDYKDAIAEMEARKGNLMKDNPAYYRRIESTVLKKNCMAYLAGHNNLGKSFTTGKEIATNQVRLTQEMDQYAATVKFFEQAFEWDLMDYTFYPFYWANREKWTELYGMDNDDELFRSFLRSGMARTIVTVRPGFEEAVMYYMATGLVWNGGEVPVIGDDLYLSIIDELKEPEYVLDETWETRVPSTLTLIQADTVSLDADGLPCYCDTETPPNETIAVPDPNPLDGLSVHIDGAGTGA